MISHPSVYSFDFPWYSQTSLAVHFTENVLCITNQPSSGCKL